MIRNGETAKTKRNGKKTDGKRGGKFGGGRGAVSVGIRPEHIQLVAPGKGQCDGTVDVLEYLGADTFVIVDGGVLGQITVRQSGDADLTPGATVGLEFEAGQTHFFDDTGLAV